MAIERVILATPSVAGRGDVIAAPFQWLFTGEDNLRVVLVNSLGGVVVTLQGRFLGLKDRHPQAFVHTFVPTADRQPTTFNFGFGDGFLLNCSMIVTSGTPLIGQTYCMLQIIRGLTGNRIVLGCLLAGYITGMQHLAYPGSPIESSIAGGGFPRNVVGTVPAPGTDIGESVPTGARHRLTSVVANLTTSAAAGARRPYLSLGVLGNHIFESMAPADQGPSALTVYTWATGMALGPAPRADFAHMGLPIDADLVAAGTFNTNTFGLAADDQWSAPSYRVTEWLEAA